MTENNCPFDPEFLDVIRCPITHSRLVVVEENELDQFNERIKNQQALNQLGQTVEQICDAALINADRTWVLPIRNGIVILVADQAIRMESLKG